MNLALTENEFGFSFFSTITPVVGKKRKRNTSSDNSDVEVMPAQSPREDEESSIQVKGSQMNVVDKSCLILADKPGIDTRDYEPMYILRIFL